MHILYVVQYFNLPDEPGGGRAYHFARHWVRSGHRVTVLTGTVNHKTASVPEKYRGRLFTHETVEGIDLVRCASTIGGRSFASRVASFVSYGVLACWAALYRVESPDVAYASSTPLTVGFPGWLAAVRWRCPFLFEVRDLWPESAVVAGYLRNPLLVRLAEALERFLYARAARVIAVTRGIERGVLARGVPPAKVLFVPNGVDDILVDAAELPASTSPTFRCIYVGALGAWNGNETMIEAMALLQDRPDVELVIVGDGNHRKVLEEQCRANGLRTVRFLGALPKRQAVEQLRDADLCLVCTWNHPFHRMVLANKIFDYLAAGKPVVAAAAGEMADLLATSGAGIAVEPGDAPAMADAIRRIASMGRAERQAMGARGRAHVLAHYSRRDLAERVEREMRVVVGG